MLEEVRPSSSDTKEEKAAREGLPTSRTPRPTTPTPAPVDVKAPKREDTRTAEEKVEGLNTHVADMAREIEKKKKEIERLKVVSINFNKQGQILKGKKEESESLSKQVARLNEQVANLTNLVNETNTKNDLVAESLRAEIALKNETITSLNATIAHQSQRIQSLEEELAITKGDMDDVKDELLCVREDLESTQEQLEKEKQETEVLRAAMLGVSPPFFIQTAMLILHNRMKLPWVPYSSAQSWIA